VNRLGGYKVQGKAIEDGVAILEDALALEAEGCFAIVLESVPTELARIITRRLRVPTIGIGAGSACDGQVLVFHDLLGMSGMRPKFLRVYAELGEEIGRAVRAYCEDVRSGGFPDDEREAYHMGEEAAGAVERAVRPSRPRPGWAANS
jgi:3-methyl-2-oxobutanoate hydroxymethyltransferase